MNCPILTNTPWISAMVHLAPYENIEINIKEDISFDNDITYVLKLGNNSAIFLNSEQLKVINQISGQLLDINNFQEAKELKNKSKEEE